MCLSKHLLCRLNQAVIIIKKALKYLIHKLWISCCYCRMLLNDMLFSKKMYKMFLFGKIPCAIYLLTSSTILKFLMNLLDFVLYNLKAIVVI
jgi:hypothetical protein